MIGPKSVLSGVRTELPMETMFSVTYLVRLVVGHVERSQRAGLAPVHDRVPAYVDQNPESLKVFAPKRMLPGLWISPVSAPLVHDGRPIGHLTRCRHSDGGF